MVPVFRFFVPLERQSFTDYEAKVILLGVIIEDLDSINSVSSPPVHFWEAKKALFLCWRIYAKIKSGQQIYQLNCRRRELSHVKQTWMFVTWIDISSRDSRMTLGSFMSVGGCSPVESWCDDADSVVWGKWSRAFTAQSFDPFLEHMSGSVSGRRVSSTSSQLKDTFQIHYLVNPCLRTRLYDSVTWSSMERNFCTAVEFITHRGSLSSR